MRKHAIHSTPIRMQVVVDAPLAGRRLIAGGKRGPAFTEQQHCTDCGDFQSVLVRIDGELIRVGCPVCISGQFEGRWAA